MPHTVEDMSATQPLDHANPPPLPMPGSGGREDLPGARGPGSQRAYDRRPASGGRCGFLRDRRKAGVFFLILLGVWALSGGGSFWPVWALIPLAAMMVLPDRVREGRAHQHPGGGAG